MRRRREGRGELTHPAEIGRIERSGSPDVGATCADGRQKPTAGDQSDASRRGGGPGLAAQPQPLTGVTSEQLRQRFIERDEIRRDQALAYAVGSAGEDQLQLGAPGAATPVREHALPGNLARYEDQLAVQHGTVRYRFRCRARRKLAISAPVQYLQSARAVTFPLPRSSKW